MKLRITATCDKGCVRNNNEDMVLVGKKTFRDDRLQGAIELNEDHCIFLLAVADGMGGAKAGEVASQLLLEQLCARIYMLDAGHDEQALKAAVRTICMEIHQSILQMGHLDSAKTSMGSTLIALLYYEEKLYSINAGDSRLYRCRNKTLAQISQDHSMRELSSNYSAPSNIIFNSFGGGTSFFVDIESAGKKVLDGDMFLLCSDGVTAMLSDEEIEDILSQEGYEDILLDRCKAKGGQDNISYILAECSEV